MSFLHNFEANLRVLGFLVSFVFNSVISVIIIKPAEHLVAIIMGVPDRKETELDLFKDPLRHQHITHCENVPVLVLPSAVVHVEVQRWR